VGAGDCPVVGATVREATVYIIGEEEIPNAGFNPVTNESVNTLFYLSKQYRFISSNRSKAFPIGHLSHDAMEIGPWPLSLGPWPLAPWPLALGRYPSAISHWPLALGPCASALVPRPLPHGPCSLDLGL
jgi:hypothetical protein